MALVAEVGGACSTTPMSARCRVAWARGVRAGCGPRVAVRKIRFAGDFGEHFGYTNCSRDAARWLGAESARGALCGALWRAVARCGVVVLCGALWGVVERAPCMLHTPVPLPPVVRRTYAPLLHTAPHVRHTRPLQALDGWLVARC